MKTNRLFSVLILAALLPLAAAAATYQDPNTLVNYTYTVGQSEASVRGIYPSGTGSPDATGDITILSSFTVDGNEYSVTSIGYNAFNGCTGLTSVAIPSSVTSIGSWAFRGCFSLTAVHISDIAAWCGIEFDNYSDNYSANPLYFAKHLYLNGEEVKKLNIPSSVASIGDYAFCGCTGLTSVTIPSSVTSIGDDAFMYCTGLTSIIVESGNTVYDSRNNCNAIIETASNALIQGCNNTVIPSGVTSIGGYAFYNCSGLTSVTIPSSVTTIGDYAFAYCRGLTSVTIPSSVTSIGRDAFYYTPWYNNYYSEAPNGLFYIDNILFGYKGNKPTGDIIIKDGTRVIADYAFSSCSGLTLVTIPSSVTSIGGYTFSGCSGLTTVTIPSSVTSIGDYAFSSCSGLTSVTIPSSVTFIGGGAFAYCRGLTSVIILEGVTSIGERAFEDCSSLTSVTIPSSVTSIGGEAFYGCSGLTSVTSLIQEPFEINENVFQYWDGGYKFTSATLYVPQGTKEKYEATPAWNKFKNIVEIDAVPTGVETASHKDGAATVTERYALDGQRIGAGQRGLNIVRMSDGTVRKVVVK